MAYWVGTGTTTLIGDWSNATTGTTNQIVWTWATNSTTATLWGDQFWPVVVAPPIDPRLERLRLVNSVARTAGNALLPFEEVNVDAVAVEADLELTEDERREVFDVYQVAFEQAQRVARAREHAAAEKQESEHRAEVLLISLLTPEQEREWAAHRRVTHHAPSGRRWRLQPIWSPAAAILDHRDTVRATLCIHPQSPVPGPDVVAALLLALRADEDMVIHRANLSGGNWSAAEREIRRARGVPDYAVAA